MVTRPVLGVGLLVLTDGSDGDVGTAEVFCAPVTPPVERGNAVSDTNSPVTLGAVEGGA